MTMIKTVLGMAASLALIAPTGALAEIQAPAVAQTQAGAYQVTWQADGAVDLYVSTDPDFGTQTLISAKDADGQHLFEKPAGQGRVYFRLVDAADGDAAVTALRLLPLEGGRNFRDMGGYTTADGHTVKWGHLFRSGEMDELTAADYGYLSGLGIQVICDYRGNGERTEKPTDWKAGDVDYIAWDYDLDMAMMGDLFSREGVTPADSAEAFKGFYRKTPHEFAERYKVMFERLSAGDVPLAFNCSAGKDRTGVAAALVLTALGVPRDQVVADYALSDDYVDYMGEMMADREKALAAGMPEDDPRAAFLKIPPALVAPFLASEPEYIEAMFDAVEAQYGSVRAYLEEVLGVSDDDIAAMRATLLM